MGAARGAPEAVVEFPAGTGAKGSAGIGLPGPLAGRERVAPAILPVPVKAGGEPDGWQASRCHGRLRDTGPAVSAAVAGVTPSAAALNFRSAVPPHTWQDLIERGRRRIFPRGTRLLRQGESSESVIALVEGQVRVTRIGEAGDELVLMLRGPGEVLGEMGALAGRLRSASVTAAQRCVGVVLPAHAFRGYVDRHELRDVIYRLTVERLHRQERLQVGLRNPSPVVRIAIVLGMLAEELGRTEGPAVALDLGVARVELAAMARMGRSSAVAALSSLQEAGIVSSGRRRLVVTDPARLAAAARGEPYAPVPGRV
ncbi:hypothetical protein Kpho01_28490 [Kitasatospora phosalacinea]|uniref:Cyclic nucleotide-binding domain-containing protein n=1 Tax=Kitasatospora phosalacinea TaxID=2065 RepID=A0A9W6UP03_9ACTN|nr:hypothetical protein Kpho01_28490 [Kitasatospora phosalacinea]